ncbi:hypothetical protein SCHPADRAFT_322056 [Schizopora paradoxa]|uniref:PA domain-containing protein n=1 Tax=Schizopora paradoxa TaxID=27342 RepID=A0A0H2RQW9_9AGAM|nr:hypothetical protein SCHPADRAFT_322056 [Schizopora paradoxa]
MNDTESSTLSLFWTTSANSSFATNVSQQLNVTLGFSSGFSLFANQAFLQFSEDDISNGLDGNISEPIAREWIAFVSCDANATNSLATADVFTLAHSRGAVAAVLFSEWSNACLVNPEFVGQVGQNASIPVYTTLSTKDSQTIETGFNNVDQEFYNDTIPVSTLEATNSSSGSRPANMLASINANNAVVGNLSSNGEPTNSSNSNSSSGSGNGSVGSSGSGSIFGRMDMILLHASTGILVSTLFNAYGRQVHRP